MTAATYSQPSASEIGEVSRPFLVWSLGLKLAVRTFGMMTARSPHPSADRAECNRRLNQQYRPVA